MTEARHQAMAHGYKLAECGIPHRDDIARLGDEVEGLVRALKDVDYCDPACFGIVWELKLKAIISCI